ncbi:efflux RND transporter periplasmic adaptor subunit [Endozoicomonas sp. SM1973]|uniref:Efflux RND transporter periplasmic adaptor subunit n=1 Tax=Spartinivicinus marinus TaxID=2994442 RepID=A0A853I9U6_9GAMM|nr:efflux RND transporter periplasmic adaptor subunit [Spartinivicinus marinus]MCX4027748.1 efflux RND transporter periplasmic adaptor subunit [Spartinivicinus marinus]NYZ68552.1 efflux RND transporter periplasmic adaptor subunit [Spartinivicinus marinus]
MLTKKLSQGWLAISMHLLAAILLLTACSDESQPKATQAPPTVKTIVIEPQAIHPSVEVVGRTEPTEDVKIRSRVSGNLLARHFQEGQEVQKGDLLFEIDSGPYQSEVNRLKAEMASTIAAKEVAELNYQRGKQLVTKGTISKSQMDDLTSKKLQAEAAVTASEAALKTSELNLSYTKITAPVSGRIGQSEKSIGDLISPSQDTLANVVTLDPMYVHFQANEKDVLNFKQETKKLPQDNKEQLVSVQLKLANKTIYDQTGKIDFLDNRIDESTGTLKVRAVFPNPDKLLIPGQFVTIILKRTKARQAILVPQVAVQEDQAGKFVIVINDQQQAVTQRITIGAKLGDSWEAKEGLTAGQHIVIDGLQKIKIGQPVKATLAESTTTQSS